MDGWKPRVWRNDLFKQLAQAVLEPPSPRHDERATLEYIQNHLAGDGGVVVARQAGVVGGVTMARLDGIVLLIVSSDAACVVLAEGSTLGRVGRIPAWWVDADPRA